MFEKESKPHCQCLYELENKLPRTQHCFMACPEQWEILAERNRIKIAKENEDKNKTNV